MKKLLLIVISIIMVLSFCACSAQDVPAKETEPTPEATMPQLSINGKNEDDVVMTGTDDISGFSDNLFDFIFKVDGVFYQLPCSQQKFIDNGWEIIYEKEKVMEPGEDCLALFKKNGKYLTLALYNDTSENRELAECIVGGINADCNNEEDDNYQEVYIAGNVLGNDLDYDTIKEHYGEAVYESVNEETDIVYCLHYMEDSPDDRFYNFWFDDKTGEYWYLWAGNYPAVDADITLTSMNDDLYEGIVEFCGDTYQMPIPVQSFLDNGWVIEQIPTAKFESGEYQYASLVLERDGVSVELPLRNLNDSACDPMDCYVTEMCNYDFWKGNIQLIIPCGVQVGMTESDLLAAIPDLTFDGETTYTRYDFDNDVLLYITVDADTRLVNVVQYEVGTYR